MMEPGTATEQGVANLQVAALEWYAANGRPLAFRRSADPWAVLVSEVMAQQTQAERAAAAWSAFMARYPTPAALASAPVADVIRAWRGLGYNRRAIALRAAAIAIVQRHAGRVPDSLAALQLLPGIGPYTARAVLAIAFGRPVAALDTNIQRVLERSIGGLPARPRERQVAADALVPKASPAAWTHALMDIGATFCRKRAPRCDACPLVAGCASRRAAADGDAPADGGAAADGRGPADGGAPADGRASAHGSRSRPSSRPAPRFESTNRWLRGRVLDRLRDAPDGAWTPIKAPIGGHDAPRVEAALRALQREGFLERDAADPSRARLVTTS